MTFHSEIMGEGDSLTSSSSADPWTQPDMVRAGRSSMTEGVLLPFELSKRMIYCITSGMRPVYSDSSKTGLLIRVTLYALKSWIGLFNSMHTG